MRSVVRGAPGLIRQLVRGFDALPAPLPGVARACRPDHVSQILAVLAYPDRRVVTIAVPLSGCTSVFNGSVGRDAGGVVAPPLITQLDRLTASVPLDDQAVRPPTPRVSTLGESRSATLDSYCWTERLAGGAGRGVCADGAPGHPAQILRWRDGDSIRVELNLPAHSLQVQAVRITGGFGGRQSDIVPLDVARVDGAAHTWTFRLSRRSARDTDLLIFASFANGDICAELGLHRT
ncbi:MAG TPA: hypothetical protein VIX82_16290 [Solirubrobacteraceae bacterium]